MTAPRYLSASSGVSQLSIPTTIKLLCALTDFSFFHWIGSDPGSFFCETSLVVFWTPISFISKNIPWSTPRDATRISPFTPHDLTTLPIVIRDSVSVVICNNFSLTSEIGPVALPTTRGVLKNAPQVFFIKQSLL